MSSRHTQAPASTDPYDRWMRARYSRPVRGATALMDSRRRPYPMLSRSGCYYGGRSRRRSTFTLFFAKIQYLSIQRCWRGREAVKLQQMAGRKYKIMLVSRKLAQGVA